MDNKLGKHCTSGGQEDVDMILIAGDTEMRRLDHGWKERCRKKLRIFWVFQAMRWTDYGRGSATCRVGMGGMCTAAAAW